MIAPAKAGNGRIRASRALHPRHAPVFAGLAFGRLCLPEFCGEAVRGPVPRGEKAFFSVTRCTTGAHRRRCCPQAPHPWTRRPWDRLWGDRALRGSSTTSAPANRTGRPDAAFLPGQPGGHPSPVEKDRNRISEAERVWTKWGVERWLLFHKRLERQGFIFAAGEILSTSAERAAPHPLPLPTRGRGF